MSINMNLKASVSLEDAVQLVVANGKGAARGDYDHTNTFMLVGEPGIGKTAMREEIGKRLGLRTLLFDAPSSSIEDLLMFIPDRDSKTMRAYPREDLNLNSEEPVLIMVDELSKATPAMQAQLHPLLTPPRRLGSIYLHPHSVVVATGNLTSDKVGDKLLGHTTGRMIEIHVRKPNAEEYVQWGISANLHPVTLAFVSSRPEMMASYLDAIVSGLENIENIYVYHPKRHGASGEAYASGRGFEQCSRQCYDYERGDISFSNLQRSFEGAIGQAAGAELAAFYNLRDEIPSPDEIRTDPLGARLPTKSAAATLVVMSALVWAKERRDIEQWFPYFNRLETEHQSTYTLLARRNRKLFDTIFTIEQFRDWALAHDYLWK